jgi:multidrug efflux pump subunit AcrB
MIRYDQIRENYARVITNAVTTRFKVTYIFIIFFCFSLLIPGYPVIPEPFYPLDSSPDSEQPTDCGSIFTYSATPHNLM